MSVMPPAASAAAAADGDDDEDDDVAIESVREVVAKQNSKVRRQRATVVLSDPENVGFFAVQIPDCRFYVHCTYIYNTLGSTTVK